MLADEPAGAVKEELPYEYPSATHPLPLMPLLPHSTFPFHPPQQQQQQQPGQMMYMPFVELHQQRALLAPSQSVGPYDEEYYEGGPPPPLPPPYEYGYPAMPFQMQLVLPLLPVVPMMPPRTNLFSDTRLKTEPKGKRHKRRNTDPNGSTLLADLGRNRCLTCEKQFKRPSSLQTHLYSHTGEKPFVCEWAGCERAFSVRLNMTRHMKLHQRDLRKREEGEVFEWGQAGNGGTPGVQGPAGYMGYPLAGKSRE